MVLHTKLTIKKGNKIYVSFNKLLNPIKNALSELLPYSTSVAIGSGTSITNDSQEQLEKFNKVYPLVTEAYNFNPLGGEMFITKKLVLDSSNTDALEIGELGLTAWPEEENPRVVNRFLANQGEPVYRDAGEEMTMEFTISLQDLTVGSNLVLTGGHNPFVASLLGDYVSGGGLNGFKTAKGTDETPNEIIIERENLYDNHPATVEAVVDENSKVVRLNILSSVGFGSVKELLIIYAGVVVMRSCVSEQFGLTTGLEYTGKVDGDNLFLVNASAITELTGVKKTDTGEEIELNTARMVGTSFLKVIDNPFGTNYPYGYSYKVNKLGDYIFFYDSSSNTGDIYYINGESVTKPQRFMLKTENADKVRVGSKTAFIRFYYPSSDSYNIYAFYWMKSNRIHQGSVFYASFLDSAEINKPWLDFDIADCKDVTRKVMLIKSTKGADIFKLYEYNSSHHEEDEAYITDFKDERCLLSSATGASEARVIGYSESLDKVLTLSMDDKILTPVTHYLARQIFLNGDNDEGFPRLTKNFLFAYSSKERMLTAYNVVTQVGKKHSFPNAKKLYASGNLDYIATINDDDSYSFYFVDGNFKLYEFTNQLSDLVNVEDILGVELLKEHILLFMKDGTNKFVMINANRQLITGGSYNESLTVTYNGDTTPGSSDGEVKLKAECTITGQEDN